MSASKPAPTKYGGLVFAQCLKNHGVPVVFTLTGGHVAPILIGCKALGIRVVDVRDEVTAVFAADAVARLTGTPGVAIVTAGPGVTNTVTAVKNAEMAQSPLIIVGGAAATLLKGKGALQDVNQLDLMKPIVKWATSVNTVGEISPTLQKAFAEASSGVCGPVFIETPIDILWPQNVIEEGMLGTLHSKPSSLLSISGITERVLQFYIRHHVASIFRGLDDPVQCVPFAPRVVRASPSLVNLAAKALKNAARPILLVGSQATTITSQVHDVAAAVAALGIPTYLTGMARGLLGRRHPLHLMHKRAEALRQADLVILAGVPQDFRLGYGRSIPSRTFIVSVNRSDKDLSLNRTPNLGIRGDPARFLIDLAFNLAPTSAGGKQPYAERWGEWLNENRALNNARDEQIAQEALAKPEKFCNPVAVLMEVERAMDDNSIIVADGGDFVGTASYIVRPRGPLRWLDPGPFGTLGVGGGFAMGAAIARPGTEVWLLYGDGSSAYSLAEFDTYRRHKLPVIAIIGNDAAWMQMYRDQVVIFKDSVATLLEFTDYHVVAQAYGGDQAIGLLVREIEELPAALQAAKAAVKEGKSALVNILIAKSKFREGSISV
eukprot:c25364_g1_i1.p1 GENE.c25364_g1_i1~~c25364_g1_i1.p1  ORF type:complete len:617 (+),score=136.82 c25364_g1_i1:39-1853(+)